jgi:hypothetical protein
MLYYLIRYNGTNYNSSLASKQIAEMLFEFFGLYLNVTTLRAINNTAVQNATAHGELNDTQLDDFNKECQGHSTKMGKVAYNYIRKKDRAKTLQIINDQINQKYNDNFSDTSSNCSNSTSDSDFSDSDFTNNQNEKKQINVIKHLKKDYNDWGEKHSHYQSNSNKIKWSDYEKEYIKMIYDQYPNVKNIWKLILDTILNAEDENVRKEFHIKHLNAVKIKDALRPAKEYIK